MSSPPTAVAESDASSSSIAVGSLQNIPVATDVGSSYRGKMVRQVGNSGEEEGHHLSVHHGAERKGQFIRSLPVVFVVLLITALLVIYVMYHCIPLLQIDVPPEERNAAAFARGLGELITFSILGLMLIISYSLAVCVHPGRIPDTPEWQFPFGDPDSVQQGDGQRLAIPTETKKSGQRRQCKWCFKYKPDRVHHCRVCRRCILKMDHHCPWIFNCVGWGNHKYFMLSLIYGTLSSIFLAATMFESVRKAVEQPVTPFGQMVLLLLGETLDVFLGVVVTGFLCFHLWLVSRGMTTIEFCEKQFRWNATGGSVSIWDKGCCRNFRDVFGRNPLLWLIPIDNREGDGMNFVSESTRLMGDMDATPLGRRLASTMKKSRDRQFDPIVEEASLPASPLPLD